MNLKIQKSSETVEKAVRNGDSGVFDNMAMNIDDCIIVLDDIDRAYPVEHEAIDMAITALEYRKPIKVKYNDNTDEYSCPICASSLMKEEIEYIQDENMDGECGYYFTYVKCPDCGYDICIPRNKLHLK